MFLEDEYVPGSLYAESSEFMRTQMSAYAHLWGLYPSGKRQQIEVDLDGENVSINTHIPVHMRGNEFGFLNGMNERNCKYNMDIIEISKIEADKEFTKHPFVQDMINELNEKLNPYVKFTKFSDIQRAVDAYYSITYNDKPHTVKMSDSFVSNMNHYLKLDMFHLYYRDNTAVKIASSNFFAVVNSLISHKASIVNPSEENSITDSIPKDVKYYLFSGHDTTLASILSGISNKEQQFPDYAASIVIELHKEQNEYYVHFIYNDKYLNVNKLCNNNVNK
jgi:hypothetical protein